jgi:hypothetical protein
MKRIITAAYKEAKKKGKKGKKKEWNPNPWAVCHAKLGPKKTDKFERCVMDVKEKQS